MSSPSSSDDECIAQFNQLIATGHLQDQTLFDELNRKGDSSDEESKVIPVMHLVLQGMEELQNPALRKRGGSKKCRKYTYRDHVRTYRRLVENYFADDSTFDRGRFKRRFRIKRPMFDRIFALVKEHPLFVQKYDARGKPGIHPLVKVTIALRFIAYGYPVDALDECYYLGNQTALDAIRDFCASMNELFGTTYLRAPNNNNMKMMLDDVDGRGWHGCLGSLDCTTWRWEMCQIAWVGQYIRKERKVVVQIEAMCGHDGWIWNYVFGIAGGINDLSVLESSNLFQEYCTGRQSLVQFTVNGSPYNLGYYLCDGIYHEWSTLISATPSPNGQEEAYFTQRQESTRKDIDCVFGKLRRSGQS